MLKAGKYLQNGRTVLRGPTASDIGPLVHHVYTPHVLDVVSPVYILRPDPYIYDMAADAPIETNRKD